jgi:hypothetical protein
MKNNLQWGLATLAVSACLASPAAFADTAAITFDSISNVGSGSSWTLGFEFLANADLTVTKLGSWTQGVGTTPVTVGLWDASGNLLASASVTTSSTTDGQFSFTDISAVSLTAGQNYYVGSIGYTYYGWAPVNAASGAEITYVQDAWVSGGTTLAFPSSTEGFTTLGTSGFYGANLEYITAAVPEPSTYAMLLAGLGLIGFAARRKTVA